MASTSRMLARNLLPSPSPLLAPSTRPPMSTTSTAACDDVAALGHLGQPVETLVGHLGDADVGVLGGERVRRGERAAAREGVVQRALPGVGEADEAEAFHAADDAIGAAGYGPARCKWGLSISLSDELADPGLLAEVAVAAEEGRLGRRVRLGPPVEPDPGAVRRPVGDAGGDRRGDGSGDDRDDGRRPAAPPAAARRPGHDDARSAVAAVGWCSGSGSAWTATASTRCSTSRPTPTRRAARRSTPASKRSCRCSPGRRSTAGCWWRPACSSRGCRSGSPGAPGSAPVLAASPATAWRAWPWSTPSRGRPIS